MKSDVTSSLATKKQTPNFSQLEIRLHHEPCLQDVWLALALFRSAVEKRQMQPLKKELLSVLSADLVLLSAIS